MDPFGLSDLRKGVLFGILAYILWITFLILFILVSKSSTIHGTLNQIDELTIILLSLILYILSVLYFWKGFNKLKGRFKYTDLGKIGAILNIFGINWIILGIAFYLLGRDIKNDKIEIGGILSIIIMPIIGAIIIYLGLNESIKKFHH